MLLRLLGPLGLSVGLLAPAAALADGFSAMVSDAETGIILVADQIDAPRAPDLVSRLSTIAMAIDDIALEQISRDEMITLRPGTTMSALEAIQVTALGEAGYRGPMTVLAGRIGQNARIFADRIDTVQDRVGALASAIEVTRGQDGGPQFDGFTTTRDMVRLATSLLRAHPELTDEIFDPATGGMTSTRIWMSEGDSCLLAARGPTTGRTLVAAMTGAPGRKDCFEASARLIAEQDARILAAR